MQIFPRQLDMQLQKCKRINAVTEMRTIFTFVPTISQHTVLRVIIEIIT